MDTQIPRTREELKARIARAKKDWKDKTRLASIQTVEHSGNPYKPATITAKVILGRKAKAKPRGLHLARYLITQFIEDRLDAEIEAAGPELYEAIKADQIEPR